MKTILKIVGEVVIGFGFLFGLYRAGVITSATAITVGLIIFVFILCFQELNNKLHPLTNAMAEIQKYMGTRWKFIPLHEIKPTGFVQEHSPLRNTPLGEQLLESSGGKKIVNDHYTDYERQIDQSSCPTAYDVQIEVSRLIAEDQDQGYMKPIKDFVYTNPRFNDIHITLSDVQRVMVIYLRDLYLQKHPQIAPNYEPPINQQN